MMVWVVPEKQFTDKFVFEPFLLEKRVILSY